MSSPISMRAGEHRHGGNPTALHNVARYLSFFIQANQSLPNPRMILLGRLVWRPQLETIDRQDGLDHYPV